MSDKFFIDTNVFVYCFDQKAPTKARRANELIQEAIATHKGVISYQVVQEFFNVALRRSAISMSAVDAEQYLNTVFRPLLGLHSSHSLFLDALHLQAMSGYSWYDSLIVCSAIQARCNVLYTEDLQHGQRFGTLEIKNPFL